ncbi:rRNA adenine N-6-methyltransferase family protein [Mesonia ostreae]|uniref:rRNA adenine N-6-methyltransferase family protein n=1 Tax=Mesonia ostreae TaxID=861110 RepID=A0ABU2KHR6_9FLAO|nr:rRNA adenine N-6-methyltransferase family protein [Mesonia ostreae]MDT0294219.1 rRNA adenine N-6-methyltransferase family protein [Mesonia ostreae]
MKNKRIDREQRHWILAKMGKKVLRRGGKELSLKIIDDLQISTEDAMVEFAPGIGYTANLLLRKNLKTFTGIELNEEAFRKLTQKIGGINRKIIHTNAANTGLKEGYANKLIGRSDVNDASRSSKI